MKRICTTITALFLVVMGLFASTTPGNPSATGLFKDDLKSFDQDFSALNQLEQTVLAGGKDYNQLKAENHQDLNALNFSGDVSGALLGSSGSDERLAGIPGFLWGFCLGWIGILLVYLLIEDDAAKKSQGRKAIVGCIVSGLLSIVFYLVWFASLAGQ